MLVIQNLGPSALTACAYTSAFHPKSGGGEIKPDVIEEHVFRDAALDSPPVLPIMPNGAQQFRVAGWRGKVTLRAALWADGTSFGDPVWIDKLVQRRLLARRNADITLALLRDAQNSDRPIAGIAAAVSSLAEQFSRDYPDLDVGPEAGLSFANAKHLLSGPRPMRNWAEPLSDKETLDLTIRILEKSRQQMAAY